MTIQQALIRAIKKLKAKKIKTASLDMEVLLSFTIKKPKEFLYTHPEKNLTAQQLEKFKALISRRSKGEPVAYLTNHKEFYGLDFYVDKRVLIPRPETELLVEEAVSCSKSQIANRKLTIADVGTGSGCIAISLAKHPPKATIIASDVSKSALQVARKNAKTHKVKIKFFQGSLLEPIKNKKIDIIIANLPYGAKNIWKNDDSVKFEPKIALYAKKSGVAIYEKLFKQIKNLKFKPARNATPASNASRSDAGWHSVAGGPKFILIEIDPSQSKDIKKIVKQYLPQSKLKIKKDLAGLNRVLIVSAKG